MALTGVVVVQTPNGPVNIAATLDLAFTPDLVPDVWGFDIGTATVPIKMFVGQARQFQLRAFNAEKVEITQSVKWSVPNPNPAAVGIAVTASGLVTITALAPATLTLAPTPA